MASTKNNRAASKALVIVESPAKAKTINKYLGRNYVVKASFGHIKDLPKKGLAVDVENDFEPTYHLIPGKEKVVKELQSTATKVGTIYLAADPDREGEAICAHLQEVLRPQKKPIYRVLFNEITPKAIRQAFEHPSKVDRHLVDAQQARRVLDRLVGYKISPILWEKVRRGTSAGRVQTVALRLVVERERDIQAFKPEEYWSIFAHLTAFHPPAFEAKLAKFKGENIEIHSEKEANDALRILGSADYGVDDVATKEKKRNPVPPFITSKLQQEASRKLRFSVKKTMRLAQRLYEGVELGEEGSVGLITYMRTDSTRVSNDALEEVRSYIGQTYGAHYLPEKPVFYRSKKDAQDAHEAIRPTSAMRTPDSIRAFLTEDEFKLYKLIWQRFVASQMNPALFDQTIIDVAAGPYLLRATGSVMKFDGYFAVYQEARDEDEKDEESEELKHTLPPVSKGEALKLNSLRPEQHFTEPPPRYNEASLVKALEEKGIGRPSTYAAILTTIQDREYVVKEEGRFKPTELGFIINDLLIANFSDIFDVQYTARMEEELDEIEEGKLKWTEALDEFYGKFAKDLKSAKKHMRDIKRMEVETDEVCEKCGRKMVIKWGRHGSFLACSGYPDCINTRELIQETVNGASGEKEPEIDLSEEICENCGRPMTLKRGRFGQFLACTGYPECRTTKRIVKHGHKKRGVADVVLEEKCPQCGSNLVIKHGRFGEFTACSSYPNCRYIKQKTLGLPCPEADCQGEIVERKSRRGRVFYGCSNYPNCKFTLWEKPIAETCPDCGSKILLEKTTKRAGTVRRCFNPSCHYKVKMEAPAEPPAAPTLTDSPGAL